MPSAKRLRTHPKDRLAASVALVDLAVAADALRAEPHASVSGHRQIALVRRGDSSVILFVFTAGGVLKEHRTEGHVTIHVLRGRLEVDAGGETHKLRAGALLALAPGEPHTVRAVKPTEMLLSISQT